MFEWDREMEEIVGEVDFRHEVSAAKEISHSVQTFHLEVLVPQVAVEGSEIQASSDLGRVFLRYWEECAPQTARCVGGELLDCPALELMLKSCGTGL